MHENRIGHEVVDAAIKVHTALGPGLLEGAYEACLEYELTHRRLAVRKQVPMPIRYGDVELDIGYRVDLLVEEAVVLELKAVQKLSPIHVAQLLCYLRLRDYRLGFLLNFHSVHMRDGVKHIVNGLTEAAAQPRNVMGSRPKE